MINFEDKKEYTLEELLEEGFYKLVTPNHIYMIKKFEEKGRYIVMRLNEDTGKYEMYASIKKFK